MKYYSELTKKMYDTEVSLKEAEADFQLAKVELECKKAEIEKKKKADEAEQNRRRKEVIDAWNAYEELAKKYNKDYVVNTQDPFSLLSVLLDLLEG